MTLHLPTFHFGLQLCLLLPVIACIQSLSFCSDVSDDLGKDVTEDAVCRICLVELGEGSPTVKMECSCKGELALAHRDCAVKWFTLKGNRTCDICRNKVQNIHIKYSHWNAVINVLAQTGLFLHRYVNDTLL